MSKFRSYLERQTPPAMAKLLSFEFDKSTMFVVIPCFDEPDLIKSLESLASCTPPAAPVTVIIVVNSSDCTHEAILFRNEETVHAVVEWQKKFQPFYRLHLLHAPALPSKWAGVGWARKIAMDEAIRCLDCTGIEDGILISFDADSYVTQNYFISIERAFLKNPGFHFVILNFNHPVDDANLTASLRKGIIQYELYLRYLRNAMQWCGYPHAIHTVGSSFAVKASSYVKQGGMNRRQAGEDFHFLHKIVLLGNYGFVHNSTVFPAARVSHRVPFGTGAALKRWEEGDQELFSAYALKSFTSLRPLLIDPGYFYVADKETWKDMYDQFDPFLKSYFSQTGTADRLNELKHNCSDVKTFAKRFYHLINAFWIIQYLNLCESEPEGKGILVEEATKLLKEIGTTSSVSKIPRELLEIFRQLDLSQNKSA
ncbi:MAG: glycosyltransferase family A protein [Prolixibacteraceae bacterium]